MQRFVLPAMTVVLSVVLTATADARPPSNRGGSGGGQSNRTTPNRNNSNTGRNNNNSNTGRFQNRSVTSFKGKHGHRWGRSYRDARYGCRLYQDGDGNWFYWCSPDGSYYPIDYVPYGKYSFSDNDDDDDDN